MGRVALCTRAWMWPNESEVGVFLVENGVGACFYLTEDERTETQKAHARIERGTEHTRWMGEKRGRAAGHTRAHTPLAAHTLSVHTPPHTLFTHLSVVHCGPVCVCVCVCVQAAADVEEVSACNEQYNIYI